MPIYLLSKKVHILTDMRTPIRTLIILWESGLGFTCLYILGWLDFWMILNQIWKSKNSFYILPINGIIFKNFSKLRPLSASEILIEVEWIAVKSYDKTNLAAMKSLRPSRRLWLLNSVTRLFHNLSQSTYCCIEIQKEAY